ncbi:MAG: glycosyltransferase [Planctomycetota bacterium]
MIAAGTTLATAGLAVGGLGLLSVFALYPLLLRLLPSRRRPAPEPRPDEASPTVSVIVAVRNGGALIDAKLANLAALQYPAEALQIIVASDGSTDDTESRVRQHRDARILLLSSPGHQGKAASLNRAVDRANGELLLFSDADALLAPDALQRLVTRFAEPKIGGVCGQRRIGEPGTFAHGAQASYVNADSAIKLMESRSGSVTANDGKIYCIRRALYAPIPEAVTDDLFTCLNVVAQGHRFVFEPEAVAYIRVPARSAGHELRRRRRIVSRSLRGILQMRRLLNPLRYGRFAIGLAINKVGRRLLPLWLLLVLVSSAALAPHHLWAQLLLGAQLALYGLAALHPFAPRRPRGFARLTGIPFFFCLGSWGTLLGLLDLLLDRRHSRWDPEKGDREASGRPTAASSASPSVEQL